MNFRCARTLVLLLALLSNAVLSALTIDTYPTGVDAGKSYTITYTADPPDKLVTFTLHRGPRTKLKMNETLGTANNGSYIWMVSRSVPTAGDYSLQITAGDEVNYSGSFFVDNDGSGAASPSSTSQPSASPTSSTNSTTTIPGGSSQSELTTAGKVGIGVGVPIAALLLALGAFTFGKSVRKKSKQVLIADTESGRAGEKPELDGTAAYHEISEDSTVPTTKVFELSGNVGQAIVGHEELDAEPRRVEIDSAEIAPQRHELHAGATASPVLLPLDSQDKGRMARDVTVGSRSDTEPAPSA